MNAAHAKREFIAKTRWAKQCHSILIHKGKNACVARIQIEYGFQWIYTWFLTVVKVKRQKYPLQPHVMPTLLQMPSVEYEWWNILCMHALYVYIISHSIISFHDIIYFSSIHVSSMWLARISATYLSIYISSLYSACAVLCGRKIARQKKTDSISIEYATVLESS